MCADFITPPVPTDPAESYQAGVDTLRARVPAWNDTDPGLAAWLLEAWAQMIAGFAETASETLTSDFRWIGPNLANVPVIDAEAASGTVTIVGTPDQVVPAGTHMYATVGDTRVGFTTTEDGTLTAGTAAAVPLIADVEGEAANDITGTLTLQDRYDFVDTITLDAATAGGVDAEDDDVYLDRLASRTRTFTDTPILPEDFEEIALQVAGVWRSLAVDGVDATDNEQHTITVDATGGNWTFEPMDAGQTATGLAHNISAASLQTALEALSNIEPGDVSVTGGPGAAGGGTPYVVEFKGQYANTNVTTSVTTDTLTGGAGTANVTVSRTVTQVWDPDDIDTWALATLALANVDEDGEAVTGTVKTAVDVLFNGDGAAVKGLREVGFNVRVIDPVYTTIGCTFTFTAAPGYDPDDTTDAAEQAVADFLDPANWGRSASAEFNERTWDRDNVVYAGRVYEVLYSVPGVRAVTALSLSGGTASGSDRLLPGIAPLTRAGTIVGTAA